MDFTDLPPLYSSDDTSNTRSPLESDPDIEKNWPRFSIVECLDEDRDLTKLWPFALSKAIHSIAGGAKDIKKLRSGQLVVEVDKPRQSAKRLKANVFIIIKIKVDAHRSLNTCKGSRDLISCTEDEILHGFRDQSMTRVTRIYIFLDRQKRPTGTLILNFDFSNIPSLVNSGYLSIPVEMYVPNPLWCFQCQKFWHHKTKCQRKIICARCGEESHEDKSCAKSEHCANC